MFSVVADNLTVRFGAFTAVDAVSFAVEPGEIFGFLGANGAGKTTTIRVLCGLLMPSHGRAEVAGVPVEGDLRAVKRKVGYMSQRFTLYSDLSVQENLDFQAGIRGSDPALRSVRCAEALKTVGFTGSARQRVSDLPGGLRQQVSLAAAILHDPEVVFLDEPTAGVDPASRARFWVLIRGLAKAGRTVFVTTHYMDEAEQCGRIALMKDGKLIALDSPLGLKRNAFPLGMVEVEGAGPWLKALEQVPDLGPARPMGRRFRLAPRRPGAWEAFAAHAGAPAWRFVEPSLEDVFLERVEGGGS